MVGSLFFGKKGPRRGPPGPPGNRPRNIVIEKLGFDEGQVEAYTILIEIHSASIKKHDGALLKLKNELYQQLLIDENTSTVDSLIEAMNVIQKQVEATHFAHFQDIKALCRYDQMEAYEEFVGEISRLFSRQRPPKR